MHGRVALGAGRSGLTAGRGRAIVRLSARGTDMHHAHIVAWYEMEMLLCFNHQYYRELQARWSWYTSH